MQKMWFKNFGELMCMMLGHFNGYLNFVITGKMIIVMLNVFKQTFLMDTNILEIHYV